VGEEEQEQLAIGDLTDVDCIETLGAAEFGSGFSELASTTPATELALWLGNLYICEKIANEILLGALSKGQECIRVGGRCAHGGHYNT
jgi:hypothetical protein